MRLVYDLRPRRNPPSVPLSAGLFVLGLACVACDPSLGGTTCTADLRSGVIGTITDHNGDPLEPSSVEYRVNGGQARECELFVVEQSTTVGAAVDYACWELGAGNYEVAVTVGGQTQRMSAQVPADECHVTETATLDFVFDTGPECEHAGDCELYVEGCCGSCGPLTLEDARARPAGSVDDHECAGIACGGCPELAPAPPGIVPACVEGVCEPVEIRSQDYASCTEDAECTLIPADCCGWCGAATVGNSFAIREDAQNGYRVCDWEGGVACPAIACDDLPDEVEAYCHADGHCDVRAL